MANSPDEEDDGFKSGSEDDLFLADKDWQKLQQSSLTEGFREGLDQSTEDQLQAGFDTAYAESFTLGQQVGQIRGKLAAKMVLVQDSPEKIKRLELLQVDIAKLNPQDLTTSKATLNKLSDEIDQI